jgi:hypothetical protein
VSESVRACVLIHAWGRKRGSLCADTCVGAEAWELVCGSVRACGPAVFGWPFRGGGSELSTATMLDDYMTVAGGTGRTEGEEGLLCPLPGNPPCTRRIDRQVYW